MLYQIYIAVFLLISFTKGALRKPDPTKESCIKGGQAGIICKANSNCPPCWILKDEWNCFEYETETQCPFQGMYDIFKDASKTVDPTRGDKSSNLGPSPTPSTPSSNQDIPSKLSRASIINGKTYWYIKTITQTKTISEDSSSYINSPLSNSFLIVACVLFFN